MKRRQLSSQRLRPALRNERYRRREGDPRLHRVGELRERSRPRPLPRAPTSLAPAQVKRDRRIRPGQRANHSKHWHPRQRPRQRTKNNRPQDAERGEARRRHAAAMRFDQAAKRVIASDVLRASEAGPDDADARGEQEPKQEARQRLPLPRRKARASLTGYATPALVVRLGSEPLAETGPDASKEIAQCTSASSG